MPRQAYRLIAAVLFVAAALATASAASPVLSVGPQYDSTHVYVAPDDLDRFVTSFIATFGGTSSKPVVTQVTPTPSQTTFQFAMTPVGALSVFGFKTPIPYPFGSERTGYLVTDFDKAVKAARAAGADVIVAPFPDPIGRDAIVQWPGGVNMQIYWHTTPPHYDPLAAVPENRVYVSPDRANAFVRAFVTFAHGKIVADNRRAPGVEIGKPGDTYRHVRIESGFGKMAVFVTDGHLPWPYGRELTGYEVSDLSATIAKAAASGATVLVQPFMSAGRQSAIVQFPGGYIAEIHSAVGSPAKRGRR